MQPTQIIAVIGDRVPIFWSRVDLAGPDACWTWTAGRHRYGYGVFSLAPGQQELAHRIALALSMSGGPSGAHALHSCDNPPCCNPAHLRWGDASANAIDKMLRGRARPGRSAVAFCPQGHEMTPGNTIVGSRKGGHGRTYTVRTCRECNKLYLRNRRAQRKAA